MAAWAEATAAPPERGGAAKPVHIVLALDNSGSIRQNDPKALMPQVVSAFAGRLGPGSRLGIVLFGDRADVVLALAGPEAPDFQDQVAASLKRIDYRDRRTDIPAGVERALYELRERGRPEAERLIVLLTDGMVDLGNAAKDVERARWLLESPAQEARRLGVRIFGVAFTEAADFELMQSVAQTSGGDYFRVLAAADIPGAFELISARIQEIARQTPSAQGPAVQQPPPPPPPMDWRPWAMAAEAAAILAVLGVVTMARRGRREAVDMVVPPATLYDRSGCTGVEAHPIRTAVKRIGREPAINDIVIAHDTVSAKHAELVYREGTFYARDLLSANGTFLNGKKFSDREEIREVPLKGNRDRIRFDAYEFEFVLDTLAEVPQTVVAPSGRTRLRPEPAAGPVRPPAVPAAQPAEPAAAAAPVPPAGDGNELRTRVKSDMCPRHAGYKATELCATCLVAYCKLCVEEKDGKVVCVDCFAKVG